MNTYVERRRPCEDTEIDTEKRERKDGRVKTEAEVEMIRLQAKEHQGLTTTIKTITEAWNRCSLSAS